MIEIQVNEPSQTLDLLEGGEVLSCLSYAEATRGGFRCVVEFQYVEVGGEFTQKNVSPTPDVSLLTATRSEMSVTKRDGTVIQVPSVVVSKSGKRIAEVMLPFELDE
jgi:hypothetical protein